MGTSTAWTDSTLLDRVSAQRRQRLSRLSRSTSSSALPAGIVGLIAGLIIGLPILGWWLWPVELGNADPSGLSPMYREAYVAMVADSYALNGDLTLARARLGAWDTAEVTAMLQTLQAEATQSGSPVQARRLQQMASDLGAAAAPTVVTQAKTAEAASATASDTGGVARLIRAMAPVVLVLMGALGLLAGAYVLIRAGKIPDAGAAVAAIRSMKLPALSLARLRRATEPKQAEASTPAQAPAQAQAVEQPLEDEISLDQALSILAEEIEAEEEVIRPAQPVTLGAEAAADAHRVVGNFAITYRHGTGEPFDTSFSIETESGEFLGECGVGVAETFGDTSPERVCAMEIWLFDKSDIRTTTKVIASDYALQDPDTRSAVTSRGEAARAESGQSIVLETAALRLRVDASALVYAQSPDAPPNSYFQELALDLTAIQK